MQIDSIMIFIFCIFAMFVYQLFIAYKKSHPRMDPVNEFLKKNYSERHGIPNCIKRARCKDGFEISIQADHFMYCEPREDKAWPYTEVELGFPSGLDNLIDIYAEDPGTTETVYKYVPIEVVNELIEKHGWFC